MVWFAIHVTDLQFDLDDAMEANLLDVMVEDKIKFQSSYSCGESAMDIFMDRKNPWNKSIHPALPKIIQEKLVENRRRGKIIPLWKNCKLSLQIICVISFNGYIDIKPCR